MRRRRVWNQAVFAAALAAGTLPLLPAAPHALAQPAPASLPAMAASAPTAASAPVPIPTPEAILASPTASQDQRNEAALRIASRRTPDSRQLIVSTLNDLRSRDNQLAMTLALSHAPDPDPQFIDPLFALLAGPARNAQAAGRALAAYRLQPDVLNRVSGVATSRRPLPERLAAIDALGGMVDKSAADKLMQLIAREDEPDTIRNRAADALGELTGLAERNSRDPQRWARWWQQSSRLSDGEFRSEMLASRAQRLDPLQERYDTLAAKLLEELKPDYLAATPAGRAEKLLRWLSSPAPELRKLGVAQLAGDKDEGRPIPPQATARLREMIGDSDPLVRLEVAFTVQRINQKDAFVPLSDQLAIESIPTVRAAQVRAIGTIGELRAIPQLIALLNDDSLVVAKAAADAIRDLGATIAARDRALAIDAARQLRIVIDRTRTPVLQPLRESAVDALAELREPGTLDIFDRLLNPSESLRVRRSAIKGIGNIGAHEMSDKVAYYFDKDPEPGVQLEAARTLGKLGSVEFYGKLADKVFAPGVDDSLRQESWQSIRSLLPKMEAKQLSDLSDRFKNDPEKRLEILRQYTDVLQKSGDPSEYADQLSSRGHVNMDLHRYADAASDFGTALGIKLKLKAPPDVIERLISDRLESQLRAGNYPDAIAFAEQVVTEDPVQMQTAGVKIKREADRLLEDYRARNTRQSLDDAQRLIDAARKMNPPLARSYLDQLQSIENDIHQEQAKNNRGSELPREPIPSASAR